MPDLAALIRQALPAGVFMGLPQNDEPWPGEALKGAVPARLTEFHQGRSAARAAMRAAGLAPTAVPMNPDRSPCWSDGMRGSISHCAGACMAIAGKSELWDGLGIDLEPATPMHPDLWHTVLDPSEMARLPRTDPGMAALKLFVAKEAAYKTQFAKSGQLIDFHDFSAAEVGDVLVRLTFARDVAPFVMGQALTVRLFDASGLIAGLCTLARD